MSIFVRCEDEEQVRLLFAQIASDGDVKMPVDDYGFSSCFGWPRIVTACRGRSARLIANSLIREGCQRVTIRAGGGTSLATRIASMSASHASLTDIPAADVAHTDAKWTPVRNHFGITAFGVNAYTARNAGDRLIGEHDHAEPTDEQHQELYFVHTGHARFQLDGQDVDAPAGTFVSALDVKTIRSAVALSDNTVVLVIGAEPGAPYEVTPAERAELAAAGLPATPA
jgi:hypothetical protein